MILKILQIIGIVLLSVLGLVLVLIILALVLPVRYRLSCTAEADNKPEGLLKISYFFSILRARAEYTDAFYVRVKVLFFTVFKLRIPDDNKDEGEEYDLSELDDALDALDEEEADSSEDSNLEAVDSGFGESDNPEESEIFDENADSDTTENNDTEENGSDENVSEDEFSDNEESSESAESREKDDFEDEEDSVLRKIKLKFEEICDKIRRARSEYRYYRNLYNSNEAKNAFFTVKKRLKRILKKILPRRAHADITFGFDSPDFTGKVYGVYTLFAKRFDASSRVIPDFERKVFEGNLYCKGHFNLWCILWNALCVILNRNVIKLYRSYKHHSKRKENHEAAEEKAA